MGLPDDPRRAAGIELLAGGAILLVAAFFLGQLGGFDPGSVSTTSWIGFGWFIAIAVGGFTASGFLTRTMAPSIAATFSYINPVAAVKSGWLLFGERVTARVVLATVIIVVGLFLIIST